MKRPLMGAGIALVAGVATAMLGVSWLWICLGAVGLNICIKFLTESSFKYMLGLSVFLIVGFCRGLLNAAGGESGGIAELAVNSLDASGMSVQSSLSQEVQGRICRVQEKENSTWLYVKISKNITVLVVLTNDGENREKYYKGQILKIWGEAETFSMPGNPGQFNEKSYYLSQGASYRLWAEKIVRVHEGGRLWRSLRWLEKLREELAAFYQKNMGESGAGVLMAAVLGDRSGFQEDLRQYYQENGWMHLVTTSGLHLSFIAMGLYRALRKSTISIIPSTVVALIMMMAYGYMTDFGDSMRRAMGMMIFLLIGKLLGRKMDVPTALVLTADVLLLLRPERLFSAGFQLSFSAVAGMELGKYFSTRRECTGTQKRSVFQDHFCGELWDTLWIQLGIFLATLPVLLWHMYEVPLLGFFYNFFMIPLVSIIVPTAFLTGLIGISHLPLLAGVASLIMQGIDWLLQWIHKLPAVALICGRPQWLQITLFCICVGSAILLISGRFSFQRVVSFKGMAPKKSVRGWCSAVVLTVGCLILMFVRDRPDRILCIDVGQGDGICILGENGQSILVDGGSSDVKKVYKYRIEPMLKYYGIRKIDAWFLTHGDSDHVSGAKEALEGGIIPIRQFILPDVSDDETLNEIGELAGVKGIPVSVIRPGEQIKGGNFKLVCLYPQNEWSSGDKNNDSLVLFLTRAMKERDFTMLLTGDLEKKGEAVLLEKADVPDCDVLKVGHHGSSGATSEAFLKMAAPEWALISCGEGNRYNHPHDETLRRLEEAGCQYLTTAKGGALLIRFLSNEYRIRTWKPISGRGS